MVYANHAKTGTLPAMKNGKPVSCKMQNKTARTLHVERKSRSKTKARTPIRDPPKIHTMSTLAECTSLFEPPALPCSLRSKVDKGFLKRMA